MGKPTTDSSLSVQVKITLLQLEGIQVKRLDLFRDENVTPTTPIFCVLSLTEDSDSDLDSDSDSSNKSSHVASLDAFPPLPKSSKNSFPTMSIQRMDIHWSHNNNNNNNDNNNDNNKDNNKDNNNDKNNSYTEMKSNANDDDNGSQILFTKTLYQKKTSQRTTDADVNASNSNDMKSNKSNMIMLEPEFVNMRLSLCHGKEVIPLGYATFGVSGREFQDTQVELPIRQYDNDQVPGNHTHSFSHDSSQMYGSDEETKLILQISISQQRNTNRESLSLTTSDNDCAIQTSTSTFTSTFTSNMDSNVSISSFDSSNSLLDSSEPAVDAASTITATTTTANIVEYWEDERDHSNVPMIPSPIKKTRNLNNNNSSPLRFLNKSSFQSTTSYVEPDYSIDMDMNMNMNEDVEEMIQKLTTKTKTKTETSATKNNTQKSIYRMNKNYQSLMDDDFTNEMEDINWDHQNPIADDEPHVSCNSWSILFELFPCSALINRACTRDNTLSSSPPLSSSPLSLSSSSPTTVIYTVKEDPFANKNKNDNHKKVGEPTNQTEKPSSSSSSSSSPSKKQVRFATQNEYHILVNNNNVSAKMKEPKPAAAIIKKKSRLTSNLKNSFHDHPIHSKKVESPKSVLNPRLDSITITESKTPELLLSSGSGLDKYKSGNDDKPLDLKTVREARDIIQRFADERGIDPIFVI